MDDWAFAWQMKMVPIISFLKISIKKKPKPLLINKTFACFYESPCTSEQCAGDGAHTGYLQAGEMNRLSDSDKLSSERKITP